jgi:chemotaxis protein methyltransferase CheR
MLSPHQFDRTRRLASRLAGIELVERHRELLHRRSQRLGIRDDAGLEALLAAAERGEVVATQRLLGLLTTKFTGFFRHPRHFELAAEHALRAAVQRGRARLWSAGTATGEEAWSLAMAVSEIFPRNDPPVSIMATDVDVAALATALRGEYGGASLQVFTPERRKRFLKATSVPNCLSITPALHRLVAFQAVNLIHPAWPVEGPFDVIFCRNVLMYLEAQHRHAVLERMAALLAPDGLLMLDPTEHLGDAGRWFQPGAGGVYSLPLHGGPGEHRQFSTIENVVRRHEAATRINL